MFTGIVGLAKIINILSSDSGWELTVESSVISPLMKTGDSVAIDGACLSAIKVEKNNMYFFVSLETIDKTIIRNYLPDTKVNIELPMQPNGYLGGHYVLGHVDTTAVVSEIIEGDKAWLLNINIPSAFEKYVVYKGSIAINGVSLTINKVTNNSIELCIIPVTIAKTNLSLLKAGELVNIEFDILAKYTEQLLNKREVGNV
ncbi:MAG: riboflavin synthase [Bacteroidota bacterium]|nr:riboflavin synthase [Bacteroidota bacterium]